jgi:predicted nuclease of restriction endonuclease-like RecB superfamily
MVQARRAGDELRLSQLAGARRQRALELASAYIGAARSSVGDTREVFAERCAAVPTEARDKRLAAGLRKLVEDRCTFESAPPLDPRELRRALFERASETRRALADDDNFERELVVAEIAERHGLTTSSLERLLYADLRAAHRLLAFLPIEASDLITTYELAQAQAVLLRAYEVKVEVRGGSPALYRRLFRKLKFLRLLCLIEPLEGDDGYRLQIDGPYSLFRAVTKYGLQLALVLPLVRAFPRWSVEAQVKWAKRGGRLRFSQHGAQEPTLSDPSPSAVSEALPEETRRLMERFEAQTNGAWTVRRCGALLSLQGVGVCVPDLVFEQRQSGFRVYFESLGYWSREAVWQRVRLVEQGLVQPILFAVSDHLRVSEAALSADKRSALYVYKRVMSRKAVEEKLEMLRRRATRAGGDQPAQKSRS